MPMNILRSFAPALLVAAASAELDKLKAALQPLAREDVDAIERTGKPAAQLLAGYTR